MAGLLHIHVHNDFAYKEINIGVTNESNLFESLFVELWRKDSTFQKFIVGNIYRLPSYISADVRSFTNEFTNLLNVLRMLPKFGYMCGDYNIDLLKIQTNDEFQYILRKYNCYRFCTKNNTANKIM